MKNLYIIGNGFDCHHGLCSSFGAYRTWLQENNPELYNKMSDYYTIDDDEWWWQFELNLGKINLVDYISNTAYENQPKIGDLREYTSQDGLIQAENDIGGMVDDLKKTFREWLRSQPRANSDLKIKLIPEDSFFINFNYTRTLQKLYNISDSQILHIHGDIEDYELVLGHNKTYAELNDLATASRPDPPVDLSIEEPEEWYGQAEDYTTIQVRHTAIDNICRIRKDVESIIQYNHSLFSSMKDIEHIYVFGFSFSPIDLPYIDQIVQNIDTKKVKWCISYYNQDDKNRIELYMESKGISSILWKPLIKLKDLQIIRQLSLF